jgi:hypothetical protein
MSNEGAATAVLIPVEQETVTFYGRELVAVRLEDGRICAVLRWLCEGMGLDANGQGQRIQRKTALRDELVTVRVETAGGQQAMPALTLRGLPGWLYGIDETRVSATSRPGIILFQRECTDVLATHFARRAPAIAPPASLVPAEPIAEPAAPARDAARDVWRRYHEQMAAWLAWQEDIEQWRAGVEQRQDALEDRMEGAEAMLQLVPELIERLGPITLTPEHQRTVQNAVKRLHELGGYAYATIYADLGQSFHVAKYDQIHESDWLQVAEWLRVRIESAERRQRSRGMPQE